MLDKMPDWKFAKVEPQATPDGSTTLFVPELDEHYHSVYGAATESMHVFINSGLKYIDSENINILEIGLGTGLNLMLTALNKDDNQKIFYHAVEKYPLSMEICNALHCQIEGGESLLATIHSAPWNESFALTTSLELLKSHSDIHDIDLKRQYNLVYFDAFAPDKQPDMWSEDVFEKIYSALMPGGILVTYCSKGVVKQALRSVGFIVKRLEGPPHKHHMLRAIKQK